MTQQAPTGPTVSVVGAGNIGGTLVQQLAALGYRVAVANARGPEHLRDLERETGATAVAIDALPVDAELVIVAVPPSAFPGLRPALERLPAGAVVVDTANYVPGLRDPVIAELESGEPESRWSSARLGRPVVKAFNTVGVASLQGGAKPAGAADRIAVPVSGDEAASKQRVIALLDELGFDGFDAGSLEDSWRQQPGTPIYTANLPLGPARRAVADARRDDTPRWRTRMAPTANR